MSWFSSAVHAAGNVVGPTLEGVGTAYDYLTPGKGSSKATNVGKAITNPNVTLSDPSQLQFGGQSGFSYTAPTQTSSSQPAATHAVLGAVAPPTAPAAAVPTGPSPQELAQYGYYTGLANDALGRLNSQYGKQQGAVGQQYQTNLNEYNSAKTAAGQAHNQGVQTARQNFVTDQNQINQNAQQERQSLLRQLGILGAGGGSAALFALPTLLGQQTNRALSGAGQNYAQNASQADTAYNNYINTQYTPGIQKLEDWKQNQLQQEQADYNQTHTGLLNVLRGLNSHADTASNLAGTLQMYEAQIPNTITPANNYTGEIQQYTAPAVSQYEQQVMPQAQIQPANQPGQTPMSYLALLAGNKKKQSSILA